MFGPSKRSLAVQTALWTTSLVAGLTACVRLHPTLQFGAFTIGVALVAMLGFWGAAIGAGWSKHRAPRRVSAVPRRRSTHRLAALTVAWALAAIGATMVFVLADGLWSSFGRAAVGRGMFGALALVALVVTGARLGVEWGSDRRFPRSW